MRRAILIAVAVFCVVEVTAKANPAGPYPAFTDGNELFASARASERKEPEHQTKLCGSVTARLTFWELQIVWRCSRRT
jgi:hypothetical protein